MVRALLDMLFNLRISRRSTCILEEGDYGLHHRQVRPPSTSINQLSCFEVFPATLSSQQERYVTLLVTCYFLEQLSLRCPYMTVQDHMLNRLHASTALAYWTCYLPGLSRIVAQVSVACSGLSQDPCILARERPVQHQNVLARCCAIKRVRVPTPSLCVGGNVCFNCRL